jgi:hypothetical protein
MAPNSQYGKSEENPKKKAAPFIIGGSDPKRKATSLITSEAKKAAPSVNGGSDPKKKATPSVISAAKKAAPSIIGGSDPKKKATPVITSAAKKAAPGDQKKKAAPFIIGAAKPVPNSDEESKGLKNTETKQKEKKGKDKAKDSKPKSDLWWRSSDSKGDDAPVDPQEDGENWYTPLPADLYQGGSFRCTDDKVFNQIRDAVKADIDSSQQLSNQKKGGGKSGEDKWVSDMIKSGTLSDKVAALALKVAEAPTSTIDTLETLVRYNLM